LVGEGAELEGYAAELDVVWVVSHFLNLRDLGRERVRSDRLCVL